VSEEESSYQGDQNEEANRAKFLDFWQEAYSVMKNNPNAMEVKPSGGNARGGSPDKKRSHHESTNPSKTNSHDVKDKKSSGEYTQRSPIPSWVEKKMVPFEKSTTLFSTLIEGSTRLKGPISHDKNIWIKFQSKRSGGQSRWIIVPYIASKTKCEPCSHSPKCFITVDPCKRCGFYGHSKCLHQG
jgi:hypothetical protein